MEEHRTIARHLFNICLQKIFFFGLSEAARYCFATLSNKTMYDLLGVARILWSKRETWNTPKAPFWTYFILAGFRSTVLAACMYLVQIKILD